MSRKVLVPTGSAGDEATLSNTSASQVTKTGSNTIQLSDASAFVSGLGVRMVLTGSGTCLTRYAYDTPSAIVRGRIVFSLISKASGIGNIALLRNDGATPVSGRFIVNNALNLIWRPASGADTNFTTALTLLGKYQLTFEAAGNSTTAGSVLAKLYSEAGALLESKTITAQNMAAGLITHIQMLDSTAVAQTLDYGIITMEEGSGAELPGYVPLVTGEARPLAGDGTGDSGWAFYGTATDLGSALRDADRTSGVESPDITSTATERIFTLPAMTPRSSFSVTVEDVLLTAGSATNEVKVYKGTTLMATRTLTATGTAADRTVALTSAQITAIGSAESDWANIRIGVRTVAA